MLRSRVPIWPLGPYLDNLLDWTKRVQTNCGPACDVCDSPEPLILCCGCKALFCDTQDCYGDHLCCLHRYEPMAE